MFRIVSTLALGFLISTARLGQAGSTQVSLCEQRTTVDQSASAVVARPNISSTDKPASTKSDCTVERVQIEFEGLRAFTKADVLKLFREERLALAAYSTPRTFNPHSNQTLKANTKEQPTSPLRSMKESVSKSTQ